MNSNRAREWGRWATHQTTSPLSWLVPAWALLLAVMAFLDASQCWTSWRQDSSPVLTTTSLQCNDTRRSFPNLLEMLDDHLHHRHHHHRDNNEPTTCPVKNDPNNSNNSAISWAHTLYLSCILPVLIHIANKRWIAVAFCLLCMVEAVRQTRLAHQRAMETAALDQLEKKLAKVWSATQRASMSKLYSWRGNLTSSPAADNNQLSPTNKNVERRMEETLHTTFRVWTPVLSTLLGWFLLLPWPVLLLLLTKVQNNDRETPQENDVCTTDPSWATLIIDQGSRQLFERFIAWQESLVELAWKVALPFKLWQPLALIQRLRVLARWARYIRFAGPLLRLALKLQDQFWVFTKTWRDMYAVQLHKTQRLAHRSMVFADLRRIESLTKVQTTLASLPSQLFTKYGQVGGALLAAKKEQGERLKRRLAWLKAKLLQPSRRSLTSSTAEVYDCFVDLAQEVTTQVKSAFWNSHLISPQTRFSVAWRIVVTCTLLSELYRFYWSWELSGTFDMRYTDMTRRLLGLCQTKSQPVRRWIGKVFKLPYNHPWLDTCRQSSPSSQLSLTVARLSEIGIDLVGFLDIFVWFHTGELDEMGVVVPKPFFYRCILPGTLIQVLDHPTFPQALPLLIRNAWLAAGTVGYGRVIRWGFTMWPAMELFIIGPLDRYFFRPMNNEEYSTYSESLGLMRTFSTGIASYSSPPIPPPEAFNSYPSQMDLLENSIRSITEDNEGYGLFY